MYDAHTHLNSEKMFPNREQYMDLFVQAGWKWLVNSGASEFYNQKWIEIAQQSLSKYPEVLVKASIWRHPLECVENLIDRQNYKSKMEQLQKQFFAYKTHIVAIGETWIDVHYPNWPETLDLQKELFAMHCDFAQETNLPIVVHSRDNFSQTIDILQNYKNLTVYFHCWWYWPEEYLQLKDLFPKLFIWFCGNITYKNTDNLKDTLKIVEKNHLLMETDAPYLTPQIVRWQTNHPAYVAYIYKFASDFLNIKLEDFKLLVETNIKRLYNF